MSYWMYVCLVCTLVYICSLSINLFEAQTNPPHKKKQTFLLKPRREINHDFFFTLIWCSSEMSEKSILLTGKKKFNASYKQNNCIILSWFRTCVLSKFEEYSSLQVWIWSKFKYPFQIEVLPVSCLQLQVNKTI